MMETKLARMYRRRLAERTAKRKDRSELKRRLASRPQPRKI